MLVGAVGVEELAGEVGNGLPLPGHDHAGLLGDHGHAVGLQVLGLGELDKLVCVLGGDHYGHTLLGLGDGQLGAVQAVVLLADGVEVDLQAISQLTNGNRNAACAKVVAALDEAGDLGVTEQSLDLALLGGVTLLHLGGHGGQRLHVVGLGGAGSTADAVAAGTAAQQDDDVPCLGALAADVVSGSGGHNGTALQALGDVAVMVDLGHVARSQTDLVTVGGIACGGGLRQLTLGELTGNGLGQSLAGITATRHAHGLMDVGATRQGVTDAAADTGSRAAEGLDLGGVVVGLVLEHEEPVLLLAVDLGGDVDGAGVDLLALVQLGEQTPLLQHLARDGGDIHEGLRTLSGLLLAVHLNAVLQITLVSLGHGGVVNGDVINVGREGGVTAVVRPVGVHHADLGDGGISLLLVAEVGLQELQIVQIHGQAKGIQQRRKSFCIKGNKAFHGGHGLGDGVLDSQGLGLVHGGLAALHGVDDVLLDGGDVSLGESTLQDVDLGGADGGAVALALELDALGGGVGPLVELTGQRLHGEDRRSLGVGQGVGDGVQLGLGEDGADGLIEQVGLDVLHVVAVEQADGGQPADADEILQFIQKAVCLVGKLGSFLYKYAINHNSFYFPFVMIRYESFIRRGDSRIARIF